MSAAAWLLRRMFHSAGRKLIRLGDRIPYLPGKVLGKDGPFIIYRLGQYVWRLDPSLYMDREILDYGVFEAHSLQYVLGFVKPGMTVFDIGANSGYYTVYLSHLVGSEGHVYAFEPFARFRSRLIDHLRRNRCSNVTVSENALSNQEGSAMLFGTASGSATIHCYYDKDSAPVEVVRTITLDKYVEQHGQIGAVDFVKVDIDGHESRFLIGATQTLRRFRPVLLMEFAHANLLAAGSNAEQLADQLEGMDYVLGSERTSKPYANRVDLLRETMNYAYSANVLCWPKEKQPISSGRRNRKMEL